MSLASFPAQLLCAAFILPSVHAAEPKLRGGPVRSSESDKKVGNPTAAIGKAFTSSLSGLLGLDDVLDTSIWTEPDVPYDDPDLDEHQILQLDNLPSLHKRTVGAEQTERAEDSETEDDPAADSKSDFPSFEIAEGNAVLEQHPSHIIDSNHDLPHADEEGLYADIPGPNAENDPFLDSDADLVAEQANTEPNFEAKMKDGDHRAGTKDADGLEYPASALGASRTADAGALADPAASSKAFSKADNSEAAAQVDTQKDDVAYAGVGADEKTDAQESERADAAAQEESTQEDAFGADEADAEAQEESTQEDGAEPVAELEAPVVVTQEEDNDVGVTHAELLAKVDSATASAPDAQEADSPGEVKPEDMERVAKSAEDWQFYEQEEELEEKFRVEAAIQAEQRLAELKREEQQKVKKLEASTKNNSANLPEFGPFDKKTQKAYLAGNRDILYFIFNHDTLQQDIKKYRRRIITAKRALHSKARPLYVTYLGPHYFNAQLDEFAHCEEPPCMVYAALQQDGSEDFYTQPLDLEQDLADQNFVIDFVSRIWGGEKDFENYQEIDNDDDDAFFYHSPNSLSDDDLAFERVDEL